MILRELATSWVRANCPRIEVQEDFLQRLDDALRQGVGCSFIIGRKLTKAGKPYLVYCFCGELFAFQLTPRQAARLKVNDAMLVSARGLNQHNHEPHPEPPVRLEQVEVDHADALGRLSPITGAMKCRTDQPWLIPLALQVTCEPAGRTSMMLYHHLDHLPRGNTTIHFSLSPVGELRDRRGRPFAGVLPLFFQLCIVGGPEKDRSAPEKLGEPFIPPSPMPTLMPPETMNFPRGADPWPQTPQAEPAVMQLRAISDIRAVLIDVI